jgi:NAD(P)H-dependent FMN reductase
MSTFRVGYFVGSLSSTSINRVLSRALIRLAPEDLEFTEIPIGNLPLYSQDYDENYPPEARALKEAIARSDAILFVTPEYNRSIPGALKNAIDWASRGPELLRPHPGRRDRGINRADRHGHGPTEPARRAELLQRPADDRTGGVYPVLP